MKFYRLKVHFLIAFAGLYALAIGQTASAGYIPTDTGVCNLSFSNTQQEDESAGQNTSSKCFGRESSTKLTAQKENRRNNESSLYAAVSSGKVVFHPAISFQLVKIISRLEDPSPRLLCLLSTPIPRVLYAGMRQKPTNDGNEPIQGYLTKNKDPKEIRLLPTLTLACSQAIRHNVPQDDEFELPALDMRWFRPPRVKTTNS